MTASAFSRQYDEFRKLLIRYRKDCSLTQSELAAKIHKPQSFVSKYENGERRLDVVEMLEICVALRVDPHLIIAELVRQKDA